MNVFDFATPTPRRATNRANAFTARPPANTAAEKAAVAHPMIGARRKRSANQPIGSDPRARNAPDAALTKTMTPSLTWKVSRMFGANTEIVECSSSWKNWSRASIANVNTPPRTTPSRSEISSSPTPGRSSSSSTTSRAASACSARRSASASKTACTRPAVAGPPGSDSALDTNCPPSRTRPLLARRLRNPRTEAASFLRQRQRQTPRAPTLAAVLRRRHLDRDPSVERSATSGWLTTMSMSTRLTGAGRKDETGAR